MKGLLVKFSFVLNEKKIENINQNKMEEVTVKSLRNKEKGLRDDIDLLLPLSLSILTSRILTFQNLYSLTVIIEEVIQQV